MGRIMTTHLGFDFNAICRACGHPRRNHARMNGGACLHWDDQDYRGFCNCDGFVCAAETEHVCRDSQHTPAPFGQPIRTSRDSAAPLYQKA